MSATVTSGIERWAEDESRRLIVDLPYTPFPKQEEFHHCNAKYRLFGGSAGPGKSKALLMEAVLQAHRFSYVNTLLLRRTFPELEGSLLLYFRRDVPRELYLSFNESKHTVTWRNGSTTRFGHAQSENDIYKYQSSEFLFIGIDELTHFTLRQWQFLTSRNRCPVRNSFCNMAGATNPGNIGHAWVKSLFIDKQAAPGMEPREYDPSEYAFISARVWDNPIYANDSSYLKSLNQLPDFYRRAFLDGDWSVFAGQYFTNFDPSRTVVRAGTVNTAEWWPRWISIDWGFEHPAAVYWHTQSPISIFQAMEEQRHRLSESQARDCGIGPSAKNVAVPKAGDAAFSSPPMRAALPVVDAAAPSSSSAPSTITYREFIAQHLSPRVLAAQIIERSRARDGRAEKIDAVYLSPDAFARRTDEASIAEQMGDILHSAGLPRPVPADNDRIGGWMLMYQMLDGDEWVIADSCPELIRTLPELVRDTANVEDIAKRDGDDAADAARYGLKSRPSPRPVRPPHDQEFQQRITSTDPTIRAIQIQKAHLDLRGKGGPVPRPGARAHNRRWMY
ncbi:MAG TPA: phage terminase large subunit [Candidatus Acidoferrales bacterium]|nr:phage terminase large subunit [Candidatus Acidoferrales bacterium]